MYLTPSVCRRSTQRRARCRRPRAGCRRPSRRRRHVTRAGTCGRPCAGPPPYTRTRTSGAPANTLIRILTILHTLSGAKSKKKLHAPILHGFNADIKMFLLYYACYIYINLPLELLCLLNKTASKLVG
jgi:hypothetical protein